MTDGVKRSGMQMSDLRKRSGARISYSAKKEEVPELTSDTSSFLGTVLALFNRAAEPERILN